MPYLIAQIGIIKPKVIICLGKDAAFTLLGLDNKLTLSKIRGQVFCFGDEIKVVPTYHPSYLLRGGGREHKSYNNVIEDFILAKEISFNDT